MVIAHSTPRYSGSRRLWTHGNGPSPTRLADCKSVEEFQCSETMVHAMDPAMAIATAIGKARTRPQSSATIETSAVQYDGFFVIIRILVTYYESLYCVDER